MSNLLPREQEQLDRFVQKLSGAYPTFISNRPGYMPPFKAEYALDRSMFELLNPSGRPDFVPPSVGRQPEAMAGIWMPATDYEGVAFEDRIAGATWTSRVRRGPTREARPRNVAYGNFGLISRVIEAFNATTFPSGANAVASASFSQEFGPRMGPFSDSTVQSNERWGKLQDFLRDFRSSWGYVGGISPMAGMDVSDPARGGYLGAAYDTSLCSVDLVLREFGTTELSFDLDELINNFFKFPWDIIEPSKYDLVLKQKDAKMCVPLLAVGVPLIVEEPFYDLRYEQGKRATAGPVWMWPIRGWVHDGNGVPLRGWLTGEGSRVLESEHDFEVKSDFERMPSWALPPETGWNAVRADGTVYDGCLQREFEEEVPLTRLCVNGFDAVDGFKRALASEAGVSYLQQSEVPDMWFSHQSATREITRMNLAEFLGGGSSAGGGGTGGGSGGGVIDIRTFVLADWRPAKDTLL